jgi:para-nitrobenzyl esterase
VRPFLIILASIVAASIVQIDSGRISGRTESGVSSFKGIPYAAPPVGNLRWRPPQPVPPWTGTRPADKVGPLCKQKINTADNGVGPPPDSEDCLNLDVYAPAKAAQAARARNGRLPVMFWIHGGGYVNGSGTANLYNGTELAKQGVVVVSINYRLGRFGFFAHPALTQESPDGPLGNYAFMDQIAALQWVKRNIEKFGGDPGNVTIFGESAGGASVINLMVAPPAQGLFQRAISQSGVARIDFPYLNRENDSGVPSAEDQGKFFAMKLGVNGDDVNALRAIPAQKIVDAGDPDFADGGAILDGKILTSRADVAFAKHAEARVPFLLGSNASEFPPPHSERRIRQLLRFPAPLGARLLAAYGSEDAYETNIASDILFTETAHFLSRTHSQVAPVFLYRFSVLSEQAPKAYKAAPHASDRQYVFRTLNASPWPTGPLDEKAAALISAYWVAFAKTGDPNGAGRLKWPAYSPSADELINFKNAGPAIEKTPNAAALDAIASHY